MASFSGGMKIPGIVLRFWAKMELQLQKLIAEDKKRKEK